MRLLHRGNATGITLERFDAVDGQGAPSYLDSTAIQGRIVDEDAVVRTGDGQEIRTTLTAWVDGAEFPLPAHRDRLTVDGTAYIVVERQAPRRLMSGAVDHVRVRCREE